MSLKSGNKISLTEPSSIFSTNCVISNDISLLIAGTTFAELDGTDYHICQQHQHMIDEEHDA